MFMGARSITGSHKFVTTSYPSNAQENENLRIILNYVRSKQEFYPFVVSLVFSNAHSSFVDLVSKYVSSESIVSYKITTDDLSRNDTWQSRVDLTWILIVDNVSVLNSIVRERNHIWKSTNRYLIINTAPKVAALPRQIFQMIWSNYNVYKITAASINDNFQCLSRYLPFKKNGRDQYGVVHKICAMERESDVGLYANFENLNGYPIRVVVFPSLMMNVTYNEKSTKAPKFSGLDADAMSLLERAMGAKFHVKVILPRPKKDPFQRTLRYIEDGMSEMIITSFFVLRYDEFHKYQFTASVYEDKLCLIAPTTGFVPRSYMPIMPFSRELWMVLAAYNVLVSVLWFVIGYYSRLFRRREMSGAPLPLTTERLVLSMGERDSPPRINPYISSCFYLVETMCYPLKEDGDGRSTTSQKALLVGTLFFGLIVVGLYQSCLVSSLSNPFHYPELNTLEEIANSNFTIVTKYQNLKRHTFRENTTLANKLRSKVRVIVSDEPTNDIVISNHVIAIGRYASYKLDNLSRYYDADGNELLHVVDECPYTYLLSYVVRLYSPYRERINELLLRMREAGLVKLWYENMAFPVYKAEQRRKVAKSERRIRLTMEHYSLTFVGLLVGLLSCTIVFLAELYFAKRSR